MFITYLNEALLPRIVPPRTKMTSKYGRVPGGSYISNYFLFNGHKIIIFDCMHAHLTLQNSYNHKHFELSIMVVYSFN